MVTGSYLLVIFVLSILLLLVSIIRFKINPFLALLGTALITGLLCGMPPDTVTKQLATGFGQTLGGIGIVIGLGIIFGGILSESQATEQIAAMLLRTVGRKQSPLAINLTGYFASIPVFFDAAFVIFMPLLRDLSRDTRIPLVTYVTAMSIGLLTTHCLVIPTPGPLAVMGNMGLDAGAFLGLGMLIALPAALVGGLVMGRILGRHIIIENLPDPVPETPTAAVVVERRVPSGQVSLLVLLFPILLILIGSITSQFLPVGSSGRRLMGFIGDKNVAMLAGVLVAFTTMRPYLRKTFDQLIVEGASAAGLILLITGAGGSFGSIISASGIGDYLVQSLTGFNLSLVVMGFVLTLLIRVAQGSATVSLVTASSILAPMVVPMGANPLIVALAICCGGMCFSLPNDSGFWVVSRFGNLTVSQTLKALTLAGTVAGLTGLVLLLILDLFI
ncbi:gluconate:H+ symporter [Nibrella viscosa]|uniref:Gluconate:H+ symporter n=1 Tax=Nibrella viscosa TaxID=1084524 RepID=A0ABP8KVJ1_9BACT